MPATGVTAAEVAAAVAQAHHEEWARVLATTVRVTQDLDLAEECVQDAYVRALSAWQADVPDSPGRWLTTTARNAALDALRRATTLRRKLPLLAEPERSDPSAAFPDERLQLVLVCCHPALDIEARIALTLKFVCGLTTAEVARMLLVSEPTMAARLTRAKKKITATGMRFRLPDAADIPERLDAVLNAIHLLYTAGHTAASGPDLSRPELVERALDLARMLRAVVPASSGAAGLLALILLTDARRDTRLDEAGRLQLLEDQDRTRWDAAAIEEGLALVREALRHRPPSRYALQAAIAAVHAESPDFASTDWREIVGLYDLLLVRWPSPVVALNRAVAVGFADGPEAGLAAMAALADEPQLARYPYLPAARAALLERAGDAEGARLAYQEALVFTENASERRHLEQRLAALPA